MFAKRKKAYSITFSARLEELRQIKSQVQRICQDSPLSPKDTGSVLLVVEEVCSNIIRHAYLLSPGEISLTLALDHEKLVLTVADKGPRFDPRELEAKSLSDYVESQRKGGLGLQLVRKLMDRVSYQYQDGENRLTLIKRYAVTTPPTKVGRKTNTRSKVLWVANVILFLVAVGTYFYFSNQIVSTLTDDILQAHRQMAEVLAKNAAAPLADGDDLILSTLAHNSSSDRPELAYLLVVDTLGTIWSDALNPSQVLGQYTPPLEVAATERLLVQYNDPRRGKMYHFSIPIYNNNQQLGKVHLGIEQRLIAKQTNGTKAKLLFFCLAGFAFGSLALHLFSRSSRHPLRRLTASLKPGRLPEGLKGISEEDPEVAELLNAFNSAANRIRQAQLLTSEEERIKKETELANQIRQALIPQSLPEIEGVEVASLYRIAREIGGDYFDFIWVDPDHLGIAVADIAGKGVTASMVMSATRTALRLQAKGVHDPAQLLARVDSFISAEIPKGMFVTMFYCIYDLASKQVTCASAGHNPALVYKPEEKKLIRVNPRGLPLGLSLSEGQISRETSQFSLQPGDTLVLYTDGLIEATDNLGKQFGLDRLGEQVQASAKDGAQEMVASIDRAFNEFCQGKENRDDITLVILKETSDSATGLSSEEQKVLQNLRSKVISSTQATRQVGLEPSLYRKYRLRRVTKGALAASLGPGGNGGISIHLRSTLLEAILENPEYGPIRLARILNETGDAKVNSKQVYEELTRLKLTRVLERLEYKRHLKGNLDSEESKLRTRLLGQEARLAGLLRAEMEGKEDNSHLHTDISISKNQRDVSEVKMERRDTERI